MAFANTPPYQQHYSGGNSSIIPPMITLYPPPNVTLQDEPWYFQVNRKECEKYLMQDDVPFGTYMIRRCSGGAQDSFTLSVKNENDIFAVHVKHYEIKRTADKKGFYIHRSKLFFDIAGLIHEYSTNNLGDCYALTKPFDKMRMQSDKYIMVSKKQQIPTDSYEINESEIQLVRVLHERKKIIWFGTWKRKVSVLVKVGKIENSIPEINMLKTLKHRNIIALLATCKLNDNKIYTVLEYMNKDSLLNYLQTHEGRSLAIEELNQIAIQIADVMNYLGDNKIVHRNLAARNVLVENKLKVKLTEFSSAKKIKSNDIYKGEEGTRYALKWSAIESLRDVIFSIKSDVWSYGIFLTELYTNGQVPYYNMTGQEVKQKILHTRYRMPKPIEIPNEIFEIIKECWKDEPKERPTFTYLKMALNQVKIKSVDQLHEDDDGYLTMKKPPVPPRAKFQSVKRNLPF